MSYPYQHILVAVDESERSEIAFQRALQIAKPLNASLHIVHVVEEALLYHMDFNIDPHPGHYMEWDQVKESRRVFLEEFRQQALNEGLKQVDITLEIGNPKKIIVTDLIQKLNIDLTIVGSTGTGALERFLLGSVSEFITRNSPSEVLIVRDNTKMQKKERSS